MEATDDGPGGLEDMTGGRAICIRDNIFVNLLRSPLNVSLYNSTQSMY